MPPGYLYFAMLAAVVAPSMLINRMAVVMAAVWALGQVAFLAGADPLLSDFTLDALALFASMWVAAVSQDRAHLIAGLLFAPMLAVHGAVFVGQLHPFYAWWCIYYLAFFQIGAMLAGNDWDEGERMLERLLGGEREAWV